MKPTKRAKRLVKYLEDSPYWARCDSLFCPNCKTEPHYAGRCEVCGEKLVLVKSGTLKDAEVAIAYALDEK